MSILSAYRAGHPSDHRAGWLLSFTFDQDVIDRLKAEVPARERSYDPTTHTWWVAVPQEPVILGILPDFEAYLMQGQLL